MEWTKPLSLLLSVLVVGLVVGGLVELARTTLGGEYVTASLAVVGVVVVALLGAVALGARSVRWLENPDSYW